MPQPKDKYDEEFQLHVKAVVEEVMSTRECTVKEVEVVKAAVHQSLELLVTKHIMACEQRRKASLTQDFRILGSAAAVISAIVSALVAFLI